MSKTNLLTSILITLALSNSSLGTSTAPQNSYKPHRVNLAIQRLDPNTLVVLTAVQYGPAEDDIIDQRFGRDWLTIKNRSLNGWRVVTTKKHTDKVSRLDDEGGFSRGHLLIKDYDGDEEKEIVVKRTYYSNSGGTPEDLRVYRLSNGKLRQLGEIQSNQEIEIRPPQKGKGYQFLDSYEIGWEMGHGEMPRWHDIYEIRGNRLRQVNAENPKFFKPWVKELREVLKKHPGDEDIWAHLAYAASFARVRLNRRAEYRAVLREYADGFGPRPKNDESWQEMWDELDRALKKVRKWYRTNAPFPGAMKPYYFFGDYMKDRQSPRDMPPKGCR